MTTEPEAEELREPPAIVFAPEGPPVTIFGRIVAYKYVVATVFVSALFLDLLDTTIVNVALRTIGQEFQTEAIEWIVLGYTLALAVSIPASGWMGDRFGTKRVFLCALGAVRRRLGDVRAGPDASASSSRSGSSRASAAGCSRRSASPCCSGPSRRSSGPGPRRS